MVKLPAVLDRSHRFPEHDLKYYVAVYTYSVWFSLDFAFTGPPCYRRVERTVL